MAVLRSEFFSPHVEAIMHDYRSAGLDAVDVAIMDFARKIALNAYKITPDDMDGLRMHGLGDDEILDLVLTGLPRPLLLQQDPRRPCAEADQAYLKLEDGLREALTVGRPFSRAE